MPEGLPVAPSLSPSLRAAHIREPAWPVNRRVVFTSLLALALGGSAALVAEGLRALIALITNLAFYGRWSVENASPVGHHLGWLVVVPPVIGGVVVGLMARFGSAAIRGHGIPEAMEQVLFNRSRIPARITLLKPLSAAIAIGTGGPFGAEGPIIATGGALGSLIGQIISVTAMERKVLLAAGAAAGMAATFGTPVAAVLLAVEFLLFEFRARSIIPVAMACVAATAVRIAFRGAAPAFDMPLIAQPGGAAIATYVALGAIMGFASVVVTRAVYSVEDAFEHLPVHWMWWPAIGGLAVGAIGIIEPATMGVGYDNIDQILGGLIAWKVLAVLGGLKLISWAVALGSGTSGGTLAPLFTIGGALGSLAGVAVAAFFPHLGVDPRMAALVGMASLFAGASHAMLTWVVFAFETTRQPVGLLPLLGGCAAAYLVSMLRMRYSIMTEKIARRGTPIARGYEVDPLRQQLVRNWISTPVVTLRADERHRDVAARMLAELSHDAHQGFPVLDAAGALVGVVTLRDLFARRDNQEALIQDLVHRPPVVALGSWTLREAADEMVRHDVGRLPVIDQNDPTRVVGIITRSDLLRAHGSRLSEVNRLEPSVVASWRSKERAGRS
jgi:H+/Cl- antiporter ClcA/predicted transcriptional regulator